MFAFSEKLWDYGWKIGTSMIYLVGIIFVLNSINPELAKEVKEKFTDFINLDMKFVKNVVSDISSKGLNLIKGESNITTLTNNKVQFSGDVKIEKFDTIDYDENKSIDKKINRNLTNSGKTKNRKF